MAHDSPRPSIPEARTSSATTCRECAEAIQFDGMGWRHEDPSRIYGHAASRAHSCIACHLDERPLAEHECRTPGCVCPCENGRTVPSYDASSSAAEGSEDVWHNSRGDDLERGR